MSSKSGEHAIDPVLLLAIRNEVDQALHPVSEKLDTITERLSRGDGDFRLIQQEMNNIKIRCDKNCEEKPMNPWVAAFVTGGLSAVGTATAFWFLSGVAIHAK